jgi:AraC family transcriptional activator of pobA
MESATVPVFKLYGETRHWPTPDLLHCESIPERSRLHNWRIHPHRHADLIHLLHLSAGEVTLELEGNRQPYQAPLLIVVPAMSIHGFDFSPDTQGHILTLAQPLVERLETRLGSQVQTLQRGVALSLNAPGRIAALVEQLNAEYRAPAPGRDPLLEALMTALTIEVHRLTLDRPSPGAAPRHSNRAQIHLHRYQALIEAQFRLQPSVEQFATQLGVTSAHLNLLCRRLTNRSALQLLHERLLLEAKRQLTYTNMTVGQVADSLGFSEPAYFTRFFKRLTGLSPRDFRHRQSE